MTRRNRFTTPLARGACEACALMTAFLVCGLGWAALQGGARAAQTYPGAVTPQEQVQPRVWLVDGYNVICAGVLGVKDRERWWSEANRNQLLEMAERFDQSGAELWVVFDGDRSPTAPSSKRVHVVFAAPADDWLLAEVRTRAPDAQVTLVTSDRPLGDKARHRGALVVAPRDFVRRCLG